MFSFASSVYNDSVFFGGFPSEEWFQMLVDNGTKIFVDATSEVEKQTFKLFDYHQKIRTLYPDEIQYYNFPIDDNNIPDDIQKFKKFVVYISGKILELESGQKIYIHCKGGHGRSGMLAACILCYLLNYSPEKSLNITTNAHAARENLKLKWKNVRCPQTFRQRKFVIDVFRPIIITHSLYEEKINNKWVDFLLENNLRPLKEKNDTKILSEVLIHLRKLLNKENNFKHEVVICP
jgi:hypothetical protein